MIKPEDQEKRAMGIVFALAIGGMLIILAGIPAVSLLFNH